MGDGERLGRGTGARLEVRVGLMALGASAFVFDRVGDVTFRGMGACTFSGLPGGEEGFANSRYGESGGCSWPTFTPVCTTPIVEAGETGDVTGECSAPAVVLIVGEMPTVGEGAFGDDGLPGLDHREVNGLLAVTSRGSSTICDPSMILVADDGSDEMTIDGAACFISCSYVIEWTCRNGDGGERTIGSGWVLYLDNKSTLALRRLAPGTCIDLRRADVEIVSLPVGSEGDFEWSDPGEEDVSVGVPLSISRLRWYASFWRTPLRSRLPGPGLVSIVPAERRRFFPSLAPGEPSTPGSGEPERLTDPFGLFTLGMRLPYSSRLAFCPPSGGAPNPKLPRGIGTPPLDSNLAILERRPGDDALELDEDCCWPCWGAETLRCWRAAMRSFKFPTGCACTDLKTFTVKTHAKQMERERYKHRLDTNEWA